MNPTKFIKNWWCTNILPPGGEFLNDVNSDSVCKLNMAAMEAMAPVNLQNKDMNNNRDSLLDQAWVK